MLVTASRRGSKWQALDGGAIDGDGRIAGASQNEVCIYALTDILSSTLWTKGAHKDSISSICSFELIEQQSSQDRRLEDI